MTGGNAGFQKKFEAMYQHLFNGGGESTPQPVPQVAAIPAPSEAQVVFRATEVTRGVMPLPPIRFEYRLSLESLTDCLNSADCPATARRVFRLLHELGLYSIHVRGLTQQPTVAVFHLPVELIASHLEIDRTTVWRNLQPLIKAGVLDARDHYDSLKGQTAVTGKVWAVSVTPERVLSGQALPVKLRHADMVFPWRDLTADVERGRTAYAVTRTEARQQAEKARREAQADKTAEKRALAQQRAEERATAKMRGEKPATGRKAARENAAKTRAEKTAPTRLPRKLQQSREGLKTVDRAELIQWVLAPFSTPSTDVTLTVARTLSSGLDAVFTLPTLSGLPKRDRGAAVEECARALASSFEDSQNLRFWAWLIWQLLRGADQGQDWTDDVAHVLARVLNDVKHDETMYARSVKKPATLVVKELRASGLLDALRQLAPTRVGARPKARAA